ncbi:hypothetical protein HYT18_01445 [Candidatus Microgenomates bacterium]|nr:hypothetical protein [Candidatus Microgenomates bacterium]
MPLEIERRVALLDFIPDPQGRLEIAQKTLNPPRFSSLEWLIDIFHPCVSEDGWLDPEPMKSTLSLNLFPRTFHPTANFYIRLIEEQTVHATPQLSLPANLVYRLIDPQQPFKARRIDDVRYLLSEQGRMKDYTGVKRRLLEETWYEYNGSGRVLAKEVLREALAIHKAKIESYLSKNGHTADNLR